MKNENFVFFKFYAAYLSYINHVPLLLRFIL